MILVMTILLIWTIAVKSPVFQFTYRDRLIEIVQKLHDKLSELKKEMEKDLSPEEVKELHEEMRKKGVDPDEF